MDGAGVAGGNERLASLHELHHRLAIFDLHGRVTSVVTMVRKGLCFGAVVAAGPWADDGLPGCPFWLQSDVVAYLHQHADALGPLGDKVAGLHTA